MKALQKSGADINVKLLVRDKSSRDADVFSINKTFFQSKINFVRFAWERFVIFYYNRFSKKNLFIVSIANTGTDLSKNMYLKEADIIHLHWINQGMLSLVDIQKLINLGKPIVWTMHDLWPVTGICHYPGNCEKYKANCYECYYLNHPSKDDLSHIIFERKRRLFSNSSVQFVGCSQWISEQAKQSALFPNARFHNIPNPINTAVFTPIDKTSCRHRFNLPENKKLVLFGAAKINDPRKGVVYLKAACQLLKSDKNTPSKDIEFIFFGKLDVQFTEEFSTVTHSIGYIYEEEQMIALYNAADLFVIPSLEDNLPNTIMEAMACGLPCVGFNVGGIPEMIDHKKNGYVANYKDATDLAAGIQWSLAEDNHPELSLRARQKVLDNYSEDIVANQYLQLYSELIENKNVAKTKLSDIIKE